MGITDQYYTPSKMDDFSGPTPVGGGSDTLKRWEVPSAPPVASPVQPVQVTKKANPLIPGANPNDVIDWSQAPSFLGKFAGGLVDVVKKTAGGFLGNLKEAVTGVKQDVGAGASPTRVLYDAFGNVVQAAPDALNKAVNEVTQTPYTESKPFLQKIGEDVAAIGAGIPHAVAHPVDTVLGLPVGVIDSFKNVFNAQSWKEHPGLNLFTVFGAADGLGALGESSVVKGGIRASVDAGATEAVTAGLDAEVVNSAFASKAATQALKKASRMALDTGETGLYQETARAALKKAGVATEVADQVATKMADAFGSHLEDNAGKLALYRPVKALKEAAQPTIIDPIRSKIFGDAPNTAVGHIYGPEVVAKDPQGFLDIEHWAAKQVEEQGLQQTVQNRIEVMNNWAMGEGDWKFLTPEERVIRQQGYIKASEFSQQVAEMTGDPIVATRKLSTSDVQAMSLTLERLPDTLTADGMLKELEQTFGGKISANKTVLQNIIDHAPTKEALLEGLKSLEHQGTFLPGQSQALLEHAQGIANDTGYSLREGPVGKPVSYAEKATPESLRKYNLPTPEELTPQRPWLGRKVQEVGLSPQGTPSGTLGTAYQAEFTQNVIDNLVKKYGEIVRIGDRFVPVEDLYTYLNKKLRDISSHKVGGGILRDQSLIDLDARALAEYAREGKSVATDLNHPFDLANPAIAKEVVKIAKQSLADVPWSKTGLADGLVNLSKAKIPGFNNFVKLIGKARYDWNPVFAFKVWGHQEMLKAMSVGDFSPLSFGERVSDASRSAGISKLLEKVPYAKDAMMPKLTFAESKLVDAELFSGLDRGVLDPTSNPELNTVLGNAAKGTMEENASFARSIQSPNIFLRMMGYNTTEEATFMVKAIAQKYGMSLEDALGSTVVDGKKVYNNPEMAYMLKDTSEAVWGYAPGFQTSPLVKTLNTVWFPFRFQTKVMTETAKWFNTLSPVTRVMLTADMANFGNWAQTKEGLAWRRQNSDVFASLASEALPYTSMANSVNAALGKDFFGGKMGQLGGIPFNFLVQLGSNLGIIPQTDGETSTITGKKIQKYVPKDLASAGSVSVALEDIFDHVFPSVNLYRLSGGNIESTNTLYKKWAQGIAGVGAALVEGKPTRGVGQRFQKQQMKRVPLDYTRFGGK